MAESGAVVRPPADPRPPAAAAGVSHRGLLPGAVLLGLAVVLAATAGWAVTLGQADITVGEVWASAWHHVCTAAAPGATCPADPLTVIQDAIIWQGRAPRVLAAAAVGAGLAVVGAVMQALTRNPLADPYLLGVSSGASVGAVLVLVLGLSAALPVAAFAGALAALVVTLALAARRDGGLSPVRTVLAGVAVAQLGSAIVSFVIFWSATGDSYREILAWLMGSLGGATWSEAWLAVGATAVVGTFLAAQGRTLDAFTFGDVSAASLGVAVTRTRWVLLGAGALLTALLVSVAGSIGFVGLVVPHAVRLLVGGRHHRLLPVAALGGAIFLLLADTVARSMFEPRELPVGILTAAIGAPVFALLLRRRGRE
ncbi:putative F420-0 ABC transporter permease subunit [Georgenia yuyongxinii]|uniref:Iron chelate uptake ABC transporter family permease subunit n=1 Tax=Georgenia yuyongxinii TaxID=2589797 RepID=A0A552WRA6_9MICO|nr:putative F420-0 ABC transporter permease subunit [Georgenia yuyongxinii]TRW45282.1 iron chelate uptake ABC transporter family permease subunit [Georgenia yuyongxinii]